MSKKLQGEYYDTDMALRDYQNNMMNGGYTVRIQDMKKRINKAFGKMKKMGENNEIHK